MYYNQYRHHMFWCQQAAAIAWSSVAHFTQDGGVRDMTKEPDTSPLQHVAPALPFELLRPLELPAVLLQRAHFHLNPCPTNMQRR